MPPAASRPLRTEIDPASHNIDGAEFRLAMRHLAGAVSVITVGQGDDRTGFTATSVSSFSADSPTILVSVNRSSSSWPALQRYRSFCVNVLADDQQAIADNFAGRGGIKGVERYQGADWTSFATGTPALSNALTVIDCELEEAIERHSHAILIGAVRGIALRSEAQPLLYWHGSYRRISNTTGPGEP